MSNHDAAHAQEVEHRLMTALQMIESLHSQVHMLQLRLDAHERQLMQIFSSGMVAAQGGAGAAGYSYMAIPGVSFGAAVASPTTQGSPSMAGVYYFPGTAGAAAVSEEELRRMGLAGGSPSPRSAEEAHHAQQHQQNNGYSLGAVGTPTGGLVNGFPATSGGERGGHAATMALMSGTANAEGLGAFSGGVDGAAVAAPAEGSNPSGLPSLLQQTAAPFIPSGSRGPMMMTGTSPHVYNHHADASAVTLSGGGGNGRHGSHGMPTAATLDPLRSTNETLESTCQQTWLKEVCLKSCKNVTDFNALAHLRSLWKLNLQGCTQHVDDQVVARIASFNKRLSRLNLCGCELITDATPLAQLPFLFDLNLSGCMISDNSLQAISQHCSQLSRLAINSCPKLTSVACVGQLKELKLLYCRYSANIIPSTIVEMLGCIGKSLLTLNIDGIHFASLDLSSLPEHMALKNFNSKDNIELKDLQWMVGNAAVARRFSSLEMIDVEGCTHLATIGDAIGCLTTLRTLRLSRTAVTQEELEAFVKTRTAPLSTLYLDGCTQIHDVGVLKALPSLNRLVLEMPASSTGGSFPADGGVIKGVAELRKKGVEVSHVSPNTHHGSPTAALGMTPAATPTTGLAPAMPASDPHDRHH